MDAKARKKAFRAKLNASKQEKQRIDSPLVRYNEHDQPVCRVCDIVLKSESAWPAHQASRKHHDAINNLKANATSKSQASNIKPEPLKEIVKSKSIVSDTLHNNQPEASNHSAKPRPSSALPSDFFDNQEPKRQRKDGVSTKTGHSDSHTDASIPTQADTEESSVIMINESSNNHVKDMKSSDIQPSMVPKETTTTEAKQVKGALPEGFFDNKDADLRARGIMPVKPDVKDEYKEFEKLIQEDLKEVDNRLEEEEIDAAETIEEAESVEQRTYRERVELLKRKKLELQASRSAVPDKGTIIKAKETSVDESSSDDDSDDDNFTVDWRAKHL